MRCSRLSITTWVRALSSVPISGSARMPSQSLTTGVESSSMLLLLARDDLLAALLVDLGGVEPEPVEQVVRPTDLLEQRPGVLAQLVPEAREERLLEGEHEGRGLRGAEALEAPASREPRPASRAPGPTRRCRSRRPSRPGLGRRPEQPEELLRLGLELAVARSGPAAGRRSPAAAASSRSAGSVSCLRRISARWVDRSAVTGEAPE